MTYGEIIRMIDIYTETPSCINTEWFVALAIVRKLLMKEIDKGNTEINSAKDKELEEIIERIKQYAKAT